MTNYKSEAFADLGIIALESVTDLGENVNRIIAEQRESTKNYLVDAYDIRFSNGEGKVQLKSTVRGKDIYILCDVGNYSCTYNMFGHENYKGPDEHFQDIKRALSAIGGKARRVTVIMPLLYASRQHRRKSRESLDCAMALQELERLGVSDVITFDVHDPNIQNAIPLVSFENLYPTYDIVKTMFFEDREWFDEIENTVVIAPDTGAMDRAIYYAGVLGINVGLFYKRRDYTTVVNGKNPIVAHEYVGPDIEGKNILIVDDMIASGESVLDIARDLTGRGAKNVFVSTTFALFTEGIDKFDAAFEEGIISRVYSTNLTYTTPECETREWHRNVDMSEFLASVVNDLNYDKSISSYFDATTAIRELFEEQRELENKQNNQ